MNFENTCKLSICLNCLTATITVHKLINESYKLTNLRSTHYIHCICIYTVVNHKPARGVDGVLSDDKAALMLSKAK